MMLYPDVRRICELASPLFIAAVMKEACRRDVREVLDVLVPIMVAAVTSAAVMDSKCSLHWYVYLSWLERKRVIVST